VVEVTTEQVASDGIQTPEEAWEAAFDNLYPFPSVPEDSGEGDQVRDSPVYDDPLFDPAEHGVYSDELPQSHMKVMYGRANCGEFVNDLKLFEKLSSESLMLDNMSFNLLHKSFQNADDQEIETSP